MTKDLTDHGRTRSLAASDWMARQGDFICFPPIVYSTTALVNTVGTRMPDDGLRIEDRGSQGRVLSEMTIRIDRGLTGSTAHVN